MSRAHNLHAESEPHPCLCHNSSRGARGSSEHAGCKWLSNAVAGIAVPRIRQFRGAWPKSIS